MTAARQLPPGEARAHETSGDAAGMIGQITTEAVGTAPAEAVGSAAAETVTPAGSEKFGADRAENFPTAAPIDSMRNNQLTLIWSQELQREFGDEKNAVKKIARLVDVNTRTAKNWLYGVNTPDLLNALKLMAHVPALAAETRRLIGMHADLDPEFQREFINLQAIWSRMLDRAR